MRVEELLSRILTGWSIRTKTLVAFVGITVVVLSSTSLLIVKRATQYLTDQQAMATMLMAEGLTKAADLATMTGDKLELTRLAKSWQSRDGVLYVRIETLDGKLLAEAGVSPSPTLVALQAGQAKAFDTYSVGAAAVKRVIAHADEHDISSSDIDSDSLTESTDTAIARVIVATSTAQLRADIDQKTQLIFAVLAGAGLSSFLLSWLGVNSLTRRLSRLSAASERISGGDLSAPMIDSSNDELGRLSHAFESMRTNLQAREVEMQDFNDTLLDKVQARTADLEKAMHAAESANRAKSDFLANMSHEIRTPMAAILGNADLLSEPDQTHDERVQRIGTIQRSGEHLLGLINDILDISKIEAGKMSVEELSCSPRGLLMEVHALMEPRAQAKNLQLVLECETALPETIKSDPMRLRQILLNLISNALKFTQSGSITIRVSARPTETDGELTVKVIDTGIGMSAEAVGKLFRAFEQADNTMSRRFGGTGLGLVIARRLANLLHGDLTVVSAPGQGSTFTLVVRTGPLNNVKFEERLEPASSPTTHSAATVAANITGKKILLVEDGVDNQRLIMHHLSKAGARVQLAENGKLGLDAYEASVVAGTPFDLIFMDMQMPEMDGYTATQELRKRGRTVPIVALTAHALTGDREKCLAAGCDDYTTKPVKRATLLGLCDRWIKASDTRRAA